MPSESPIAESQSDIALAQEKTRHAHAEMVQYRQTHMTQTPKIPLSTKRRISTYFAWNLTAGLLGLLSVNLTGCSTGYLPNRPGIWTGYSDTKLAPNTFRITYSGRGAPKTIQEFATLRAAEVCLDNGFSHFKIISDALTSHGQGDQTHTINVEFGNDSKAGGALWIDAGTLVKALREQYRLKK